MLRKGTTLQGTPKQGRHQSAIIFPWTRAKRDPESLYWKAEDTGKLRQRAVCE